MWVGKNGNEGFENEQKSQQNLDALTDRIQKIKINYS